MDNYKITFVDHSTGTPVAEMVIKAIDYSTAQELAECMNTPWTAYADLITE